MAIIKQNKEYFGPFSTSFREYARLLIHWGYEGARDKIQHPEKNQEKEETITDFLIKAIKDQLRDFDQQDWCKFYSVHENPPISEEEGPFGGDRPRADIIIELTFNGRPEYVFEAKRLKKNEHPVGGYTGPDGMGCFISGKYASRYDESSMLGYVQSDSLEEWKGKVKGKIDKDAEKLSLIGPQRNMQVIDAFPLEWLSEHNRNSLNRSITIYHILLDCCVE